MNHEEKIPRKYLSRSEMENRIARFSELKGFDGGLPDSYMPGAERVLYNVLGFQPPEHETKNGIVSPVGEKAARMSAIKISEGFNLGYCEALPGKGPMMHNHDTNETFICMTGKWRASWENEDGTVEHADLMPMDVISFAPGMIRRFENITNGPKDVHSVLMFIIAGNGPGAEFTKEVMSSIEEAGLMDSSQNRQEDTWTKPYSQF